MKKGLIVIDVQKYFLTDETKIVVDRIGDYLKTNLEKYFKVYFTIFKNDPSAPLWKISDYHECCSSPDIDICDQIKAFTNKDNLFYKNILSAVKVPEIIKGIKNNNITEVYLCGFDTDCCILATAYDLFDQGIKPIILEKLSWSTSKAKLHNPALQIINRNIGFIEE